MTALDAIADWPVPTAAAAVVAPSGIVAQFGDPDRRYALASVTKPLVARAVQVAVEEGVVELDTAAGPPGSTVRHLLAHASGLSMKTAAVQAQPGHRRIYSNYGFEVLAEAVQQDSEIEFVAYLREAVFEPLEMGSSSLVGGNEAAGFGGQSCVADLAGFAGEPAPSDAGFTAAARGGDHGSVPWIGGGAAGLRRAAAQRLGVGL